MIVCEKFLIAISGEINTRYAAKSEEFARRLKDKKKKADIKPDDEQIKLSKAMSDITDIILLELST